MSKYHPPPPHLDLNKYRYPQSWTTFEMYTDILLTKNYCKLNVKYDMKVNSFENKNQLSNFLLPTATRYHS